MAIPRAQELTERIRFINVTGPVSVTKVATEESIVATVWARITEGGGPGQDPETQQVLAQTQTFEIWTQYISGITSFLQIEWGDRVLVISATPQKIKDQFGRYWLLIQAQETIEAGV